MLVARRRFLGRHGAAFTAAMTLPGLLMACAAPAKPPAPVPTPAASASAPPVAAPVASTAGGGVASPYAPGWKLAQPARLAVSQSGALVQTPLFVAQALGFFEQFGLDVTLSAGNPGEVGPLMSRSDVKAVILAPSVSTFNLIARDPAAFAFIAGNTIVRPDGTASLGVVARKDLFDAGAVRTVADLKGQRLGVAAAWDGLSYQTGAIIRSGGLAIDEVQLVELGSFPAVLAALEGKTVDGAVLFEPLLSVAVAQNVAVLLGQRGTPDLGETFVWANRSWATTDEAVAFLSGLILAQRLLREKGLLDPIIEPMVEQFSRLTRPQLANLTAPAFVRDASLRADDLETYQTYFLTVAAKPLSYTAALDMRQQVDTTALTAALRVVGQEP
jgi:NitT/TauT family transport system substrate-binding protein